jgi:hypothetical protein
VLFFGLGVGRAVKVSGSLAKMVSLISLLFKRLPSSGFLLPFSSLKLLVFY